MDIEAWYGRDFNYATTRFRESGVLFKDGRMDGLIVDYISGGQKEFAEFCGRSCVTEEVIFIPATKILCPSKVKAGWTFIGGCGIYFSRVPNRRSYKQGITVGNSSIAYRVASIKTSVLSAVIPTFGQYPKTLDEFQKVRDLSESTVPFSRKFALDNKGKILYKRVESAVGFLDGRDLVLFKRYHKLIEALGESWKFGEVGVEKDERKAF